MTPDGRYFVVRGRLWRTSNPALPEDERARLVTQLMTARRAVGAARRSDDPTALVKARMAVDAAKVALGERGPVWWTDGAPDHNRRMASNTPYAEWYDSVERARITPVTDLGGIVQEYANLGGDSGVERFEIGSDCICVQFRDGFTYLYDHETTGAEHVDRLKALALAGRGLGSYISQHVRYRYASKSL